MVIRREPPCWMLKRQHDAGDTINVSPPGWTVKPDVRR